MGESLDWPLTSMWGGPLLCDYQDAPQSSIWYDAFFFSPEKLFIAHCGKEWKWIIALMGWHLVWAVQLTTNAQLEAEAAVRLGIRSWFADLGVNTTDFILGLLSLFYLC